MLLFRGTRLIDSTAPARGLLAAIGGNGGEYDRLIGWLTPRMPDLSGRLQQLPDTGSDEIFGVDGRGSARLKLLAEDLGDGYRRFNLTDPGAEGAGIIVDSLSQNALEEELHILRELVDHAPMLAWHQEPSGAITWANDAYLSHMAQHLPDTADEGPIWPIPALFDLIVPETDQTVIRRARLGGDAAPEADLWFDCHIQRKDSQIMCFALPAGAAVRAERSLREFVQTLTKTFADLPIGLAIFDKDRALQLFNPALIDLTGLSAGFLIGRPTLYAFLDRLREARMVPEPKNYRSWREQMSNLESAAASGHHVETWLLPGGQTYRVTGRPHPDGAVAFLFEDITSETSLTRKFRTDLSMGRAVIEAMDDAIIVFSATGQTMLANAAYQTAFGLSEAMHHPSAPEALRAWQSSAQGGAGFERLRGCLNGTAGRQRQRGAMMGPDGRLMNWHFQPLQGGLSMVRFEAATETLAPTQPAAPQAAPEPQAEPMSRQRAQA
ncbi:PAS-domain containing protein [Paracoccus pacificus]|uniref:PAS-domain containing protein n=1 Tax=Paracoccus pacificus TaxID=1463598 RepID=A0ABW4R6K3_9RHOB